jgi:hypothetical protein
VAAELLRMCTNLVLAVEAREYLGCCGGRMMELKAVAGACGFFTPRVGGSLYFWGRRKQ